MAIVSRSDRDPRTGVESAMIDSHVHAWDPRINRYRWLEGELDRPFLPGDLGPDDAQPAGSVFVQADADDGLAEAHWVDELDWPRLRGIVAFAPVERPELLGAHLADLATIGKVVGVRRLLQDEPVDFSERPELVEGLRTVAAAGLTFDACIRAGQLPPLIRLLESVPELDVVLDHLGKPQIGGGMDLVWSDRMRILAENPRVNVKLSGLAPESDFTRPVLTQAMPFLREAVRIFGPSRCMIGSDWPVSSSTPQRMPVHEWFSIVDAVGASDTEKDELQQGTATRFYGLDRRTLATTRTGD